MDLNSYLSFLLMLTGLTLLSGCRLESEISGSGTIQSESGIYTCTDDVPCEIEIEDSDFKDTFTAVPEAGWEFIGWSTEKRSLCRGKIGPCTFDMTKVQGHKHEQGFVDADVTLFLRPIFEIEGERFIESLAGGFHKACAQTNGRVYCWGGEDTPGELSPPEFTDPSHLTAAGQHACVLNEGIVRCWGAGEPGADTQGIPNVGQSAPPPLSNPTGVYAGLWHTCATEDTGLVCWGFPFGGNEPENEPKSGNPKLVAPGANSTCVFDEVDGLGCWVFSPKAGGKYGTPTYLRDVPEVQSPNLLFVRWENACVVENREIICWGLEDAGVTSPPTVKDPTILELGNDFGCVLDSGEVICWGDGIENPPPLSNPYDLAAGSVFACAADDTGVVCWGGHGATPGITEPPGELRVKGD